MFANILSTPTYFFKNVLPKENDLPKALPFSSFVTPSFRQGGQPSLSQRQVVLLGAAAVGVTLLVLALVYRIWKPTQAPQELSPPAPKKPLPESPSFPPGDDDAPETPIKPTEGPIPAAVPPEPPEVVVEDLKCNPTHKSPEVLEIPTSIDTEPPAIEVVEPKEGPEPLPAPPPATPKTAPAPVVNPYNDHTLEQCIEVLNQNTEEDVELNERVSFLISEITKWEHLRPRIKEITTDFAYEQFVKATPPEKGGMIFDGTISHCSELQPQDFGRFAKLLNLVTPEQFVGMYGSRWFMDALVTQDSFLGSLPMNLFRVLFKESPPTLSQAPQPGWDQPLGASLRLIGERLEPFEGPGLLERLSIVFEAFGERDSDAGDILYKDLDYFLPNYPQWLEETLSAREMRFKYLGETFARDLNYCAEPLFEGDELPNDDLPALLRRDPGGTAEAVTRAKKKARLKRFLDTVKPNHLPAFLKGLASKGTFLEELALAGSLFALFCGLEAIDDDEKALKAKKFIESKTSYQEWWDKVLHDKGPNDEAPRAQNPGSLHATLIW